MEGRAACVLDVPDRRRYEVHADEQRDDEAEGAESDDCDQVQHVRGEGATVKAPGQVISAEEIHTLVLHGMLTASGVFFFSSRRRHTRFDCDWSSDVCSSD